jgi:hypothetical protein
MDVVLFWKFVHLFIGPNLYKRETLTSREVDTIYIYMVTGMSLRLLFGIFRPVTQFTTRGRNETYTTFITFTETLEQRHRNFGTTSTGARHIKKNIDRNSIFTLFLSLSLSFSLRRSVHHQLGFQHRLVLRLVPACRRSKHHHGSFHGRMMPLYFGGLPWP